MAGSGACSSKLLACTISSILCFRYRFYGQQQHLSGWAVAVTSAMLTVLDSVQFYTLLRCAVPWCGVRRW